MPVHIEELAKDILVLKLTGKLTKEDYDHFVPAVEARMKETDTVRLLIDMHDFHGWEMAALWEDTKFAARHFKDIERIAIVGESRWEKGMAVFCVPFTKASVKYFDRADEPQAREWIHGGDPDEGADIYGQK